MQCTEMLRVAPAKVLTTAPLHLWLAGLADVPDALLAAWSYAQHRYLTVKLGQRA